MASSKGRLDNVKHKRKHAKDTAKRLGLPVPSPSKPQKSLGHDDRNSEKPSSVKKRNNGGPVPKYDWAPIDERYIKGYQRIDESTGQPALYYPTVLELSQEFNIPLATITNHSTAYKWSKQREEWQAALRKAKDDADLQALREAELRIRRKALKAAERIIDRVGGAEGTGTEPPVSAMVDRADPNEIAALAGALRRSQEVANVAIGIPKDGVRPPSTDDPGADGTAPLTAWARMRASRQEIVVGVRISNE